MTSFFDITSTLPWPNAIGKRTAVGPLVGAAESDAISELAKTTPLILVITATTAAAHNLASELPFFLNDDREILLVPDWETLPYDNFSPHEDIVSDRLKALSLLPTLESGVVIVSVTTLMHRLAPRHFIRRRCSQSKNGRDTERRAVREKFDPKRLSKCRHRFRTRRVRDPGLTVRCLSHG
jgi:transcription-repair coupling factor (superfamily II helicase)